MPFLVFFLSFTFQLINAQELFTLNERPSGQAVWSQVSFPSRSLPFPAPLVHVFVFNAHRGAGAASPFPVDFHRKIVMLPLSRNQLPGIPVSINVIIFGVFILVLKRSLPSRQGGNDIDRPVAHLSLLQELSVGDPDHDRALYDVSGVLLASPAPLRNGADHHPQRCPRVRPCVWTYTRSIVEVMDIERESGSIRYRLMKNHNRYTLL